MASRTRRPKSRECCRTPGRPCWGRASCWKHAHEKGIGSDSYLCRHLDPGCDACGGPVSASVCKVSVNGGGRTTGRTSQWRSRSRS
eukprot:2657568-Rhodomonas_salina.1